VVEPVDARRKELSDLFAAVGVHDAPVDADGAVIAVKPNDVEAACASISGRTSRVLSIAAGVPLAKLEGWLAAGTPVVRAMPNTPALVGAGAAAIAAGSAANDDDLEWAEAILGAGRVVAPELSGARGALRDGVVGGGGRRRERGGQARRCARASGVGGRNVARARCCGPPRQHGQRARGRGVGWQA